MKATPAFQITAPMVIKTLRPIETKGSLETVQRLSQRLNEIMTYGVNSGLVFAVKNKTVPFSTFSCPFPDGYSFCKFGELSGMGTDRTFTANLNGHDVYAAYVTYILAACE